MKYIQLCCALLVSVWSMASASGQSLSPLETSRELRAQMRAAAQFEDYESARRANAAALALQPGHPDLLSNWMIIAGLANDPGDQLNALEAIAHAGLSYDVDARLADTAAIRAVSAERYDAAMAQLALNDAPIGRAEAVARPPLPNALIEALAVDNETERLYLGSVVDRRIYRVEPFAPRDFEVLIGDREAIGSIFGMAVDRMNGRLYAVEGVVPQTLIDGVEAVGVSLLAIDIETGELIARHTIEGAERMGDVTVRDGVVFVSDAEAGRIYRLNGPRAELELYAEDPRFASLQGLAQARGALWAVDHALGIWRIDPVTRQAVLQPSPEGVSLIGLDGLAADRLGRLFVIRNGSAPAGVFELVFDDLGRLTTLRKVLTGDNRLGDPATVRVADDRLFVIADAAWPLFPEDGIAPEGRRPDPLILSTPIPD